MKTNLTCAKCGRSRLLASDDTSLFGSLCNCCIAEERVKAANKTKGTEKPFLTKETLSDAKIVRIDKRFAYKYQDGGHPIFCPEQMLPDKTLICKPLDKEWQESINRNCWWATGYTGTEKGRNDELALIKKLLGFGGYEACLAYVEEDAGKLLYRGQLWYGDKVLLIKGEPVHCHGNTCDLWEQNRKGHEVAIATGYGLSRDGLWRQHSWLMQRTTRGVKVVETTVKRIAYFGFVMTEDEAFGFCENNL